MIITILVFEFSLLNDRINNKKITILILLANTSE